MATAARFRLAVLAGVFLLGWKLVLLRSQPLGLVLSSSWFELCLFLWIAALSGWLAQVRLTERFRLSGVLFGSLFFVHFAVTFFCAFFFRQALGRRVSLLDFDLARTGVFFGEMIPWWACFAFAGSLVGLLWLTRLSARLELRWPLAGWTWATACASVASACIVAAVGALPTPMVDLARDVMEVASHPAVGPEPVLTPIPVECLNRALSTPATIHSPIRKILVFVMEQITSKTLLADSASLPADSFFRRNQSHSHAYTNFFGNDLDSRTGLLALLTARFIPFEAYADEDVEGYRRLTHLRSLVDLANDSGYASAYAASETEEEEVVVDLPWSKRFILAPNEVRKRSDGLLCLHPDEYEHSCEDKVLLDRLFDFVDRHDRAFLFQEFIYGHSSDYNDATHQTAVAYYGEYLDAWQRHLAATGELDATLLVVVSDHGIRDWGYESKLSTYRIPLIFIHPSFQRVQDEWLFSQLDFDEILLAELTGKRSHLPENDFIPFMGTTGKELVGAVTRELDLLLLKNRRWFQYVLVHQNQANEAHPKAPKHPLRAAGLRKLVSDYRAYFGSERFR